MLRTVLTSIALVPLASIAVADSPYAGEEQRHIKSLSPTEIEALERGDGMGFAKLAELNHYPGPRHVLDLADELELTDKQLGETKALFEKMRADAQATGKQLIEAEAALDRAFAEQSVDEETLQRSLVTIGQVRARLRYVHLEAHLHQTALLTASQIEAYDKLRGYGGDEQDHSQHDGHH